MQMNIFLRAFRALAILACVSNGFAATEGPVCDTSEVAALVETAVINGGATIYGSIQQTKPQSITLNGSVVITGDLSVPGTPRIFLNGQNNFQGTIVGQGIESPNNYHVRLNGNVTLRHIITRVNPVTLPTVARVPSPTGQRNVILGPSTPNPGDFGTVRNLIVNGNMPPVAVPPGTYGEFTGNGNNSFVLGTQGATEVAVYNFQRLTVNGSGRIEVRSPVILNIANNFIANGLVGSSSNPGWLQINISQGGIILNGSSRLHGRALVPKGDIILNGNSTWVGSLATRKLTINGGCVVRAISVNSAPTALPDTIITPFETASTVQLTGADPELDFLTYGIFEQPEHGVLTDFDEITGSVTYTPNPGFHGTDSFSFVVYDETCRSAPAQISITVQPPATPPLAQPDFYSLKQDERLQVNAPGVLANDSSPSGTPLSVTLLAAPQSGSVTLAPSGSFIYDPLPGFVGVDAFTYTLQDAGGRSVSSVTLRIDPRNQPPVADSQQLLSAQDTPVSVTLTGADPEGGAITFLLQSSPQHGVLTGTVPSLRYIPKAGFSGNDSFTFKVRDAEGLEAIGTITITVGSRNLPPIGSFSYSTANVQAPFDVVFDATGSVDTDGTILSYDWDFNSDGVIDATGLRPTHRFERGGSQAVLLIVTDNLGATGHFRRTVVLNIAPELAIRADRIHFENTPVSVTVDAVDTDGFVDKVELYLGDVLVGTLARGQTVFSLGTLDVGFYQIKARATDDEGAVTDSAWVPFVVRARPGDFVVSPLIRSATLPAVRGTVGQDGQAQEGTPITAGQPVLATNFFNSPVDYTLTLIDNGASADTGYSLQDSRVDSNLDHTWVSIASSANRLEEVSDSDDSWQEVQLPFPFTFYGVSYDSVFVSTNGVLTFGEGTDVYGFGFTLPSSLVDLPLIAPFWMDLTTVNESGYSGGYFGGYEGDALVDRGAIYYKAFADRVVIQFSGEIEDPYSQGIKAYSSWGVYNFQVVLFSNGDIEFHYENLIGPDVPTVGLQSNSGQGINVSVDPYIEGGDFSLRFLKQQGSDPWFTVDKLEGSLNNGQSEQHTITFHSRPDFAPGFYQGSIRVDHTQPGLAPYVVQVRLEILDQSPVVEFTSPDPARTNYLFVGDIVPIRLRADDANGWIRHVDVAFNGTSLARLSQGFYNYSWSGAPIGNYVLTAVATDNDGNTSDAEPVFVSISADSDNDGLPDAWEIDQFGDLSKDGLDNPDNDGRSNLKEFYLGSSALIQDLVAENLPPTAHITVARLSGEAPFEVSFSGAGSRDPDGRVMAWDWDFDGDGVFEATGVQITRVFNEAGMVPVTVRVTDDEGATASRLVNVSVKAAGTALPPRPAFDAKPYMNQAALSVAFDASASTDEDGEIESYQWDFGDGSSGVGPQIEHLYTRVGVYAVKLTVTDNDGKSVALTKHVTATQHNQSPFTETNGFLVMEGEHYTGLDRRSDVVEWAPSSGDYSGATHQAISGVPLLPELSGDRQVIGWHNAAEVSPFSDALDDIGWDNAAEVSWLVRINTPGVYYYAVRASNYASGNTAATIHVGVNGRVTSPPGGDWIGISSMPIWRQGASLGYLDAGLHRIQVRRGVHTVSIDQLAIALEKAALPAPNDFITMLPAQRRPDLRPAPPTAVITGDRFHATVPDTLTFDASASFGETARISAWTWRLLVTTPNGERALQTLSDAPTLTLSLDDFDRASPSIYSNSAYGDYSLQLTVQDEFGGTGSISRTITIADPLDELTTPSAIVIDNQDPEFSSTGPWRLGRSKNDWINGFLYAGGLAEFQSQFPGLRPSSLDYMNAEAFVGPNFAFVEPAIGGSTPKARFTPLIAEAGRYLVFARVPQLRFLSDWPNMPDVPWPTQVGIQSNEGRTSLNFDQEVGGGHWRLLGVREFAAGSSGHIEISAPSQRGFVFADAVKWVKAATVTDVPVASLDWTAQPAQNIQFDASGSHALQGELLAYLWEFGDGHQSRAIAPQHRYAAPGDYTVRLTVIDSRLAVATVERIVTVAPYTLAIERPVARLQLDQVRGRTPFTVTFNASLSSAVGEIVKFETQSGELSALGSNGSLTFEKPGRHPITLTVTDEAGLTDSVRLFIEAVPAGYAEGTEVIIEGDAPSGLQADGAWRATSSESGGALHTDDPAATLTLRPFLPHAGLYQVFLQMAEDDSRGNNFTNTTAGASASVPPTDITLSHAGLHSHIGFNATRESSQWHPLGTFMSGNGAQDSLVISNTSNEGVFAFRAVKWVALDNGLVPSFTFALDQTESPVTVNFDATSSRSDLAIIRHEWDFGDGASGQGQVAVHVYQNPGVYSVTLRITDARGAVAVARQTVRIAAPNPPPEVSLVAIEESPQLWVFDASASTDSDGIAAYLWDFGDGRTGAGVQVRHRYISPGNYTVTLRILDARDAESFSTRVIVIAAPPPSLPAQPFGAVPQASDPLDYTFTARPAATHEWDFGDGATSSEANPTHRYGAPGTYRIVLHLTDADGGVREQVLWITVGAPVGTPPPDDSPDDPAARPLLYTPLLSL